MAVGLESPQSLLPIGGVTLASVAAGIRYQDRDDLALLTFPEGTAVSAVFTKNKCCAAPVTVAKSHLSSTQPRALLINSGNANAVTGEQGLRDAIRSCELVAEYLNLEPSQVLPFSTGVIGELLNMQAMESGIAAAVTKLESDKWISVARAIMTTDTLPKGVSEQIEINGQTITITGISKGSGMICPNMATMLAFVATDANLSQATLEKLIKRGVEQSFNRITVDSDTSTNDALVVAATKMAGGELTDEMDIEAFYQALERVLISLATAIVRDGEGATKFVKVTVQKGGIIEDCKTIAYDIAHSPLVKTALFASDPNWGRILMALGKSAVESLDMQKVGISINDVVLIESGQPAATYAEELGQAVFSQAEIVITVNLNTGNESFHVWTSDLSHDYVSINADYRS